MEVAKVYQEYLPCIKENVRKSHEYFRPNYDRFNEFRRFVFESSLNNDEINLLQTLNKPQLEFNVLEAYISRLLGEFSKQEPSIQVSSDDENSADPQTIQVVEQHLRHFLFDSKNYHTKYEVYKDLLSGGFSVFKMKNEYANNMSFDQVILFDRAYDPTLCGFDPLARRSHKGDGRYCYELFPMSKEEFEEEYPNVSLAEMTFNKEFSGFNWSYLNLKTPTLIVCDYYEKKVKKVKIVKLVGGRVMTEKDYKEKKENYEKNSFNNFLPFPAIIGKPRMTEIETICRYRCIENKVIEYTETDFTMFPLIFVDGSSICIKEPKNGDVRQVTRPYVYHARGAQRLKNYAGITLANEIENMVQHKFKVGKESLPKEEEFLQAYKDVQKASVLVYNELFEQNPDARLTPPMEIQRAPTPPEVMATFGSTDSLIQNILGSYDASLGINDNQLSGVAIVEAATQSNSAAMPYIVGFLQGLQRVAEFFIDVLPKYYTTPRSIPVLDAEGKRSYVKINQRGGVPMFYDSNVLNVKVEAGASFQVQKSKALQQIISMSKASPLFAQFINTKGLPVLLDNIEIRGIDQIKELADEWQQEVEAQQKAAAEAQQQEMLNNPAVQKNQIEIAKLEMQDRHHKTDTILDIAQLNQERNKTMADVFIQYSKHDADIDKNDTELALAHADQAHRHKKEAIETHHKVTTEKKEKK